MTDPKAIDISPEAVGEWVQSLRDEGYSSDRKSADLLSALSAALSEARGKVGKAERERDRLYAGLSSIVHFQSPLTRSQVREAANELLNNKPVYLGGDQSPLAAMLTEAIASRDAALSELAKARTAILAKAHEAIGYSDSTAAFLKSIANALPSPPKDPAHD